MLFYTVAIIFFVTVPGGYSQGTTCEKEGPKCDASCNIVLCPAEGATPITIVKCFETTGKYCAANTTIPTSTQYECSASKCSNPNSPHAVTCMGTGQFPSAYNCSKSVFCSSSGQPPAFQCECAFGEIYDPATSACTKAEACPADRKPVECTSIGQSGQLTGVTGYCFICDDKLDANVYTCSKSGEIIIDDPLDYEFSWSPRAQNCSAYEPPPASSSPTPPSSSESPSSSVGPSTSVDPSSSESPSSSVTPPTSPTPNGTCVAPSQRLPDLTDCRKYYVCDQSLNPQPRRCLVGFRYDPTRLTCVKGTCT